MFLRRSAYRLQLGLREKRNGSFSPSGATPLKHLNGEPSARQRVCILGKEFGSGGIVHGA